MLNFPKIHLLVLVLTAFLFYHNSIPNECALDDILVLKENSFVKEGISGIPDILSHDVFYGATMSESKQLSWRYRPLSLISFAIEYPVFKDNWKAYHLMNILYYALLGIVLYRFVLRWIFPQRPFASFVLTLFFICSPVHPEVVANIKSRDEIFALLFLILHLGAALQYSIERKKSALIWAISFLFLALISKESNVLALVITPVIIYTTNKLDVKKSFFVSLPFMIVGILFIVMRLWISPIPEVQYNIMNDPYILADVWQKTATVFFILMKYLHLMTFPDTLIFDYGYNHIPYQSMKAPTVIISALLHMILLSWAIVGTLKRNSAAMFMLFYLMGIFMLSNVLLLVGPPMAERFLFTPGFFFLASIAILLDKLNENKYVEKYRKTLPILALLYVFFSFSIVHARNPEWKNNSTLYFADVKKAPNSFRIQAFCGMTLLSDSDEAIDSVSRDKIIRDAIVHFEKAYLIYPDFGPMYQDWGACYQRLGNIDSAEWAWARSKVLMPESRFHQQNAEIISNMRYNDCVEEYQRVKANMNIPQLLEIQRRCVLYKPEHAPSWLLLGKLYFVNSQQDSALFCWKKTYEIDPQSKEAGDLLNQYDSR
jgi:tetratricopeptide (TPR) repeat protein